MLGSMCVLGRKTLQNSYKMDKQFFTLSGIRLTKNVNEKIVSLL